MSIGTFYSIAEKVGFNKILEILLKDCWGLHKGYLGAACGCWNSGREPLTWKVCLIYLYWQVKNVLFVV